MSEDQQPKVKTPVPETTPNFQNLQQWAKDAIKERRMRIAEVDMSLYNPDRSEVKVKAGDYFIIKAREWFVYSPEQLLQTPDLS